MLSSDGDRAKAANLAVRLAQEGYLIIIANCRLTPAVVYPAGKEDILLTLEWLCPSECSFGREKIAAWGSSAGSDVSVEVVYLHLNLQR